MGVVSVGPNLTNKQTALYKIIDLKTNVYTKGRNLGEDLKTSENVQLFPSACFIQSTCSISIYTPPKVLSCSEFDPAVG